MVLGFADSGREVGSCWPWLCFDLSGCCFGLSRAYKYGSPLQTVQCASDYSGSRPPSVGADSVSLPSKQGDLSLIYEARATVPKKGKREKPRLGNGLVSSLVPKVQYHFLTIQMEKGGSEDNIVGFRCDYSLYCFGKLCFCPQITLSTTWNC
jgi:hypothetical protein